MSELTAGAAPAGRGISPKTAFYLNIVGVLFVITAVTALLLAAVNLITAPRIAAQAEADRVAARAGAVPGADTFSELPHDGTVDSLLAAYAGDELAGYCVEVRSPGFGGDISLMVGVDPKGAVMGVVIVRHTETPGVGSKTESPDFLGQFTGKSGTIHLGAGADAITGATVSSKAVTAGVNAALAAVAGLVR